MSATSSKLANGSQTMSFQSNSCQSLRVTCAIWDKKMFCPQRFICRWWKPVPGAVRVSVNANSVEVYTLETKTSNPRWCYIRLLSCDVKETRLKKIFLKKKLTQYYQGCFFISLFYLFNHVSSSYGCVTAATVSQTRGIWWKWKIVFTLSWIKRKQCFTAIAVGLVSK